MPIENYLRFDEYLSSVECDVIAKANFMLSYFRRDKEITNDREWKSRFKKDVKALYKRCEEEGIEPPEDLKMLETYLSGKKRDVYQVEKYGVASCLAIHFSPADLDGKRTEIIKLANSFLNELGGLQKSKGNFKPASGEHDRRKTVKKFFKDDAFMQDWAMKRERNEYLEERGYGTKDSLEVARTALEEIRSFS